MSEPTITVEEQVPITEKYRQDVEGMKESATDISVVRYDAINVSPTHPSAFWLSKELRSAQEAGWTITNVIEGDNGPTITFEYDG